MTIPLLDLKEQNRALEPELKAAFERVLHSGRFILGPEVQNFEMQVALLSEVRHAIGVSSGTDAILLALMTLGIGPGDEVLCPSFTFFATAGCIARTGAEPVFVDSCPVCFNLDVADAARKVTARTKAIIPVHLFGQTANMDAVMALAAAHGLTVIEDAAQALGAASKRRPAGSISQFGTFSFFPSKNLGGFGDSGMLVTNDDALADKARLLRTHGSKPKYYHKSVGGNFRMDPFQAALLSVKLPHQKAYSAQRKANAQYYSEQLAKIPGVRPALLAESRCLAPDAAAMAPDEARVVLPHAYEHNDPIWNQFTLRVLGEGRRDRLKVYLDENGIGAEIYYPVPMHRQECFAYLPSARTACPVADRLASECLSIPVFPELSRTGQDAVIAAISGFLARD